jgi:hypothetical protein
MFETIFHSARKNGSLRVVSSRLDLRSSMANHNFLMTLEPSLKRFFAYYTTSKSNMLSFLRDRRCQNEGRAYEDSQMC